MEFISFLLKGNYKRFYDNLKEIGSKNKKRPFLMFLDATTCAVLFGSGLSDYLNYKFYERTWKEKSKYVTIKYGSKFYQKYSPREYANNLSIKTNFHKEYSKYTKRDYFAYEFGFEKLKEFLEKHDTFIIKPVDGLGGSGVMKMQKTDIQSIEKFYEDLKLNNTFLEEFVVQDDQWGKISPNSVNTIRAMTRIIDGKPELFYAAARIGSGKSVVDNFHQGGVGVSIDMENGNLRGAAISKDLKVLEEHAVTKVKFDGFKIPYWDEIKNMVLEVASINKNLKVVGWDVAISNKGPLLIEANRRPGFDLVQVIEDCGTKYMLEAVIKNSK